MSIPNRMIINLNNQKINQQKIFLLTELFTHVIIGENNL